MHDLGKVLLDVALAVALGGDCLADVAMLRAEPALFGPVASDSTVSRLIDTLVASGKRALAALRRAHAEAREHIWQLAGERVPDTDGQVTVDLDGVLVIAHSEKQDTAANWKKTVGHHPLMGFVDHGRGGSRVSVIGLLRPGNAGSNTARPHRGCEALSRVFNSQQVYLPQDNHMRTVGWNNFSIRLDSFA